MDIDNSFESIKEAAEMAKIVDPITGMDFLLKIIEQLLLANKALKGTLKIYERRS